MARTYFCTVHKDEDHAALQGQPLDPCNAHMVFDSFYDLDEYLKAPRPNTVIWIMAPDESARFGWKFDTLRGIPRG